MLKLERYVGSCVSCGPLSLRWPSCELVDFEVQPILQGYSTVRYAAYPTISHVWDDGYQGYSQLPSKILGSHDMASFATLSDTSLMRFKIRILGAVLGPTHQPLVSSSTQSRKASRRAAVPTLLTPLGSSSTCA